MFNNLPVRAVVPENGAQLKCDFCNTNFGHKDEGWKQVEINKAIHKEIVYERRLVFRCGTCIANNVSITPYGATLHVIERPGMN